MTRARPPRPSSVGAAVVVAAGLLAGCGSTGGRSATPTTSPPITAGPASTTTSTGVPRTTTTTTLPADPGSSPDAVSATFIEAWEAHDRATAATVATPGAVATLFAAAYAGEPLNDRGCGSPGPNPVECSWGPYADAPQTDPIYDVTVSPTGRQWYVSGVTKLG